VHPDSFGDHASGTFGTGSGTLNSALRGGGSFAFSGGLTRSNSSGPVLTRAPSGRTGAFVLGEGGTPSGGTPSTKMLGGKRGPREVVVL
jgi:hypothetical protein